MNLKTPILSFLFVGLVGFAAQGAQMDSVYCESEPPRGFRHYITHPEDIVELDDTKRKAVMERLKDYADLQKAFSKKQQTDEKPSGRGLWGYIRGVLGLAIPCLDGEETDLPPPTRFSRLLVGDGNRPASGAVLEIQSKEGGFLLPRMTATQRDAFEPTDGMIIYNTTTDALNFRQNGKWVPLSCGTIARVDTGTGLTGGPITTSGTIALKDTTVVPGTYENPTLTVDAQGRIIRAASNPIGASPCMLEAICSSQPTLPVDALFPVPFDKASLNVNFGDTPFISTNQIVFPLSGIYSIIFNVALVPKQSATVYALATFFRLFDVDGVTLLKSWDSQSKRLPWYPYDVPPTLNGSITMHIGLVTANRRKFRISID